MSNKTNVRNAILGYMKNKLHKREGGYNYDIASAVAEEIANEYLIFDDFRIQLFPQTVNKEPYFSRWMNIFGLERLEDTQATGTINIVGEPRTIVEKGVVVVSRLGQKYTVDESVMLNQVGIGSAQITAIEKGVGGNAGIGDVVSFEIINTNINTVTNPLPISGGAPIETMENGRIRMKLKASLPAHSGNVNEYYLWVKSVAGVGNVSVVPAGEKGVPPGNVFIYFSTSDSQVPSQKLIDEVIDYLADNRTPVGAKVTVKGFVPKILNITFGQVKVNKDSPLSKDKWIESYKDILSSSLALDGFVTDNTINYIKVSGTGFLVDTTTTVDNATINGAKDNITLNYDEIGVVGTVEVTNYLAG